jgi:glycosyltransferase involved in cell wall biosynthesis
MRVLFVISSLAFGGAERQIILLSKELARRGHDVSIYTLTRETTRIDELAGVDIDVVIDQKRQRLDLGVLRRLRRHIQSWRPDIVHGFLFDGNLYSRLAAWGTRAAVLNSERSDNYAVSPIQRIGYRLTSMLFDGIVANSHAGADFARRLHRVRKGEVDVVWNGIDLQEVDAQLAGAPRPAQEIFPGPDLKRVCMVASIKPTKDHRLALRVLRRLVDDDPSWRLICVGDEVNGGIRGYKAEVLAEHDRLRLEPFVKFAGYRRDVPEIIASSDLLLVTSVCEGFPNAVLEAMACGTAVVSTDYSDVRRILPVPQTIVGSRAERDIANAVLHCYGHRAEIAKAQRRWVEQHATMSASAAALLAVYAKYLVGAAIPVGESSR